MSFYWFGLHIKQIKDSFLAFVRGMQNYQKHLIKNKVYFTVTKLIKIVTIINYFHIIISISYFKYINLNIDNITVFRTHILLFRIDKYCQVEFVSNQENNICLKTSYYFFCSYLFPFLLFSVNIPELISWSYLFDSEYVRTESAERWQ